VRLAWGLAILLSGCNSPTESIRMAEILPYMISPLGQIQPVSPKWQRGLPILRGKFVNLSTDTLYNKRMGFIITERNFPDQILSNTFGYMTLDDTEFKYFPEYPYKIERNLAPGVLYNIYVAGDTLDLSVTNTWFYSLEGE